MITMMIPRSKSTESILDLGSGVYGAVGVAGGYFIAGAVTSVIGSEAFGKTLAARREYSQAFPAIERQY
jgi:hypothetical protein